VSLYRAIKTKLETDYKNSEMAQSVLIALELSFELNYEIMFAKTRMHIITDWLLRLNMFEIRPKKCNFKSSERAAHT
jgi:hypothetical protein